MTLQMTVFQLQILRRARAELQADCELQFVVDNAKGRSRRSYSSRSKREPKLSKHPKIGRSRSLDGVWCAKAGRCRWDTETSESVSRRPATVHRNLPPRMPHRSIALRWESTFAPNRQRLLSATKSDSSLLVAMKAPQRAVPLSPEWQCRLSDSPTRMSEDFSIPGEPQSSLCSIATEGSSCSSTMEILKESLEACDCLSFDTTMESTSFVADCSISLHINEQRALTNELQSKTAQSPPKKGSASRVAFGISECPQRLIIPRGTLDDEDCDCLGSIPSSPLYLLSPPLSPGLSPKPGACLDVFTTSLVSILRLPML